MIRLIFRILAMLCLALSVITLVLDVTRSIADSTIITTSLGQDWFNFSPGTLNLSQAVIQRNLHPLIWDPGVQAILQMPSWLVFGVLAIIFGWIARRRKQNWQSRYGA